MVKVFIICFILSLGIIFLYHERISDSYLPCGNLRAGCDFSGAVYRDISRSIDDRVSDLVQTMTLDEKIGQLVLVEKNSIEYKKDIVRYGIGGILSGGGAKPEPNTPDEWLKMLNDFQEYAHQTRLQIPLLYGVDAIHGHAGVPGATVFPHQIGLGATKDVELVKKINQATAEEMSATGIYWNFSPSLDVVADSRWGRTYETFGRDEKNVALLGAAAVEGMQQMSPSGTIAILATAKHYIGTGANTWGSSSNENFQIDQGETSVDEQNLRRVHLVPFKKAIDSGVMSVMVGLNSWDGSKLSANKYLLTDVLKGELGFKGFVVSDWYAVYEISKNTYEATVTAVNAGIDMVMLPFDYHNFTADLRHAIETGDISEERLNDAVERILHVKFSLGLFDRPLQDSSQLNVIGSSAHRDLAREAVRKSLVLLKNTRTVLPLKKDVFPILVAGNAADNVGMQSGGWTVEWQGIDGNWLPGSTSILSGIRAALADSENILYDRQANFSLTTTAPIGIVIVGEKPYAEGWGDENDPRLSDEDLEVIRKVEKISEKIVVIIVSGRPLNIKNEAKNWDGIIAAWLPGSEGAGVADVLFGDYSFTGTLPIPWRL